MSTKRKRSILSIKDKKPFILWLAKGTNLSTEKGVSKQKISDIRQNKIKMRREDSLIFTFHLTGIFGNFGENSNGRFIPAECFRKKKAAPFEVFPFSHFYWCTVPFGGKFSPVFPVKWKAPRSLDYPDHSTQFPRALIEISTLLRLVCIPNER